MDSPIKVVVVIQTCGPILQLESKRELLRQTLYAPFSMQV